ncbi:MAG: type II toxin-antitoxin system RelE/ParE family toxin [Nitrospinaceae bacterium]
MLETARRIEWITAALKAFKKFPEGAQRKILVALTDAAQGTTADIAKPMKGLGVGIFEVALKYRTDAYRTVYGVQIDDAIWVLHAFKKKSKTGIKTPKPETGLIKQRIKTLKEMLK